MYSDDKLRLFCEIGLIKCLGDMIHDYHKNSRFGGFLTKLEKECIKIQKIYLPDPTNGDLKAAGVKLDRFGYEMNWVNQKKSPNFMFCFNMRLLEESRFLKGKNKKLIDIMAKLLDFQEERGHITEDHHIEGDKAYTVWLSVWGESDEDEQDSEDTKKKIKKIDAEIYRDDKLKQYKQRMYGK